MDQLPENQSPPYTRWHPRITPFRLTFVLSTITLGIAKAILVSKGNTIGSTTVEWVAGVVLALSFQFLENLESLNHRNTYARFFFSGDCLAPLWKVLPRPSYADDERHLLPSDSASQLEHEIRHGGVALVTPYRLLVSAVALGFGSAKIVCIYTGRSGVMSALDWAFSVPVALLMYYIGLYENNTVSLARGFFDADYSGALEAVLGLTATVVFTTLYVGIVLWCTYCIDINPNDDSKNVTCSVFSWMHVRLHRVIFMSFLLGFTPFGLYSLFLGVRGIWKLPSRAANFLPME